MMIYLFSPLGWYYACKRRVQFTLKLKHNTTRKGLHSSALRNDSREISYCHITHKSAFLVFISVPVREKRGAQHNIIGHIQFSFSLCPLLEVSLACKFFMDPPWLLYSIFSVILPNETI